MANGSNAVAALEAATDVQTEAEVDASVARFAAMVRRARERRGWSQAVLAEATFVEHDVICRLEAGQSDPSFSLVAQLVRVLNLRIENAVYNQRVAKRVREAMEADDENS